jgi:hypothetical protein
MNGRRRRWPRSWAASPDIRYQTRTPAAQEPTAQLQSGPEQLQTPDVGVKGVCPGALNTKFLPRRFKPERHVQTSKQYRRLLQLFACSRTLTTPI